MPKVKLYNVAGEAAGEIELNDSVFGVDYNEAVIHQAVVRQMANERLGTHATKTRGLVRGGGKKPWKQKGTGRARQGSTRSPQWRHGGVVFAPKPRDYTIRVNKKVKRLAMKSALSGKVLDNELVLFNELNLKAAKTKEMIKVLEAIKATQALIVLPEPNETVERAARNIPGIKTTLVGTLSAYEILKYKVLILTEESAKKIEEVYA